MWPIGGKNVNDVKSTDGSHSAGAANIALDNKSDGQTILARIISSGTDYQVTTFMQHPCFWLARI